MIVTISDLHLQHTRRDSLRYRRSPSVVGEIGVRRNISASALQSSRTRSQGRREIARSRSSWSSRGTSSRGTVRRRQAIDDGRRFEAWTGHLTAEGYGPYDRDIEGPVNAGKRILQITKVDVRAIDEGGTVNGAELRLFFGVDASVQRIVCDHVRNGKNLDVALIPAIALDPMLDGEVTCWGFEEDAGAGAIVDPDDRLPWSLASLPHGADGDFAPGAGSLSLLDRETDIRIVWAVR
jgi:hypothetical protein